ncbi:MAG: potassium channel family protein [Promethearchaeota archaeon]
MVEKKKKFKYKPLSLKDILKEMKQSIDLMIDFAYSAIKFGSKEIADEASKIESRIHELTFLLNLQIIQTNAGSFKNAKKLQPIVVMGYSIDKISDALADIARVVYINNDITKFTQLFWDIVPEPIVKITIKKNCEFIGIQRKDIHFRSYHGVDLIAILRNNHFLYDKNEIIKLNDVLIIKGEKEPIMELKKLCHDNEPISFELGKKDSQPKFNLEDPNIKDWLINLKKEYVQITDISETMIELALAALFFNNYELAEDILEMEELMDGLNISFEKDILEWAGDVENPRDLAGIFRIVFCCELIADAAANIAENIIKGFKVHRILRRAIEETEEIVVRETLSEHSFFKGKTYSELQDRRYKRGIHIIALKRKDKWIYSFKPNFILKKGDLLIGLGPKETVASWQRCVNPEKYREEK